MRILIANTHRSLIGGVEQYLRVLLPALAERGHQLAVLCEQPHDVQAARIDSDLDLRMWCTRGIGEEAALRAVAEWKPDVVYAHVVESAPLEAALVGAYPTVFYAHNHYGTCISGLKRHSFPCVMPCNRELGPACLALYLPRRCGGTNPGTMWRLYQRQRELKARLGLFRSVLVASDSMYREYRQNGVSEDRLHWLPLPSTDIVPLAAPPAPRIPQGRILFLGRLTEFKGADFLIRAVPETSAKLRRAVTLTVAGDGPERSRLEQLAAKLGIQAEFTGWLHTAQKKDVIGRSDLLAVPSLWAEPFGLVGLEAGALGVPAAGYRIGGIPDWLIPGTTGELAPGDPPTVTGLADAIVRALSDPDHYARLCRGAWDMAQQFPLSRHIERLEGLLVASVVPNAAPDSAGERVHV